MKSYTYQDPKFLDRFVMFINGERCELSATLMPDLDELLDVERENLFGYHFDYKSTFYNVENVNKILDICKRHKILPFGELGFNYQIGAVPVTFNYVGPNSIGSSDRFGNLARDLELKLTHPTQIVELLDGAKPFRISFEKAWDRDEVTKTKEGIKSFLDRGYRVVRVNAEYKKTVPREAIERPISLMACDGRIHIYGNVPDVEEVLSDCPQLK